MFDCCGRWRDGKRASSRSMLPEVSKYFLPSTLKYNSLNERDSRVRR